MYVHKARYFTQNKLIEPAIFNQRKLKRVKAGPTTTPDTKDHAMVHTPATHDKKAVMYGQLKQSLSMLTQFPIK